MEPEILLCFLPGLLPKPSLRAEPGLVIPRGWPVTLLCQGPAGAKFFRLEKDGRDAYHDQKSVSQDGLQGTEARFHIPSVSEDTTGSYFCRYSTGYIWQNPPIWSKRSEPLELQVTEEDVPTPPSGGSQSPAPRPCAVSVLGLPILHLTPSPGTPLALHT
ncbi:Leukocyte-associated immunoglobulin-like receptor 1 [Myotis brandtii]|nr:Leukocyte-associated immunoglobulin-like receptor 1 [Myotis brandtii]